MWLQAKEQLRAGLRAAPRGHPQEEGEAGEPGDGGGGGRGRADDDQVRGEVREELQGSARRPHLAPLVTVDIENVLSWRVSFLYLLICQLYIYSDVKDSRANNLFLNKYWNKNID